MATSSKSVQLARCIYFLTANRWSPFVLLLIASGWGRGLFSDFDSEQWRRRRAVRRFVDTVRCLCLPTRSQPHTGTARQHASLAICHSELNPDKVKSWQSSGSVEACTTSLPRETNQPLLRSSPNSHRANHHHIYHARQGCRGNGRPANARRARGVAAGAGQAWFSMPIATEMPFPFPSARARACHGRRKCAVRVAAPGGCGGPAASFLQILLQTNENSH